MAAVCSVPNWPADTSQMGSFHRDQPSSIPQTDRIMADSQHSEEEKSIYRAHDGAEMTSQLQQSQENAQDLLHNYMRRQSPQARPGATAPKQARELQSKRKSQTASQQQRGDSTAREQQLASQKGKPGPKMYFANKLPPRMIQKILQKTGQGGAAWSVSRRR